MVERLLAKEKVASSTLVFRSKYSGWTGWLITKAEVAELADAAVSKTVGVKPVPVRVRPSAPTLNTLPSGVTVAHGPLKPSVGVRIPARQPTFLSYIGLVENSIPSSTTRCNRFSGNCNS